MTLGAARLRSFWLSWTSLLQRVARLGALSVMLAWAPFRVCVPLAARVIPALSGLAVAPRP